MKSKSLLLGLVLLSLGAGLAAAQGPACNCANWAVNFMAPEDAQKIAANIPNGIASLTLFHHDALQEQLIARDASGMVETHLNWIDHIVVLDGEATMTVGGTVSGDKETAPGERRGVSLSGGKPYHLTRDAVLDINAGVPHWMTLPPGGHIRYVVFKETP